MLYEVALVKQPSKKEQQDGKCEELILAPTCVVAKDDKSAAVKVMHSNAAKVKPEDMDNIQVLVRPFA